MNTSRTIRQLNEIAAMRALFRFRRLSRAELARKLGLNRSSTGNIVASLLEAGLVVETDTAGATHDGQPRTGRPGIMVELTRDSAVFIGLEIGVDRARFTAIDLTAEILRTGEIRIDGVAQPPEATVERALALVRKGFSAGEFDRCEGVGISIPAQLDMEGNVRAAAMLGWHEIPLAQLIRTHLPVRIPVIIENDANAFAVGATYGSAASPSCTLFLLMEAGVGGGIIIGGRLFRGGNGLAGEIGHLHSADGAAGELERVIGSEAVLRAYARERGGRRTDVAGLIEAATAGDPAAVRTVEKWGETLAEGLLQAIRVIDPNQIVLGGTLAPLFPLVREAVERHIGRHQGKGLPVPVIDVVENDDRGAAYGAACLMHQHFFSIDTDRFRNETGVAIVDGF